MGRPAGHADIADKIRGAAKRALLMLEEDGKPLSELLLESFRERPLDTLNALARWSPQQTTVKGELDVRHADLDTRGPDAETFMAAFVRAVARDDKSVAGNGANGSGVPPRGDSESTRH